MSRRQKAQRKLLPLCVLHACIVLSLRVNGLSGEKWSRQVDTVQPDVINNNFDWIPLAQKGDSDGADGDVDGDNGSGTSRSSDTTIKDRTSNARVLTYSQSFPSNGHFTDISKGLNNAVIPQRGLPFDFGFAQFPSQSVLRQPRPLMKANVNTNGRHQESNAASFIKYEAPFGRPTSNRPSTDLASAINNNYQIQHAFGGGAQATLFSSPLFSQQPVFPPEFHPIPQKPVSQSLHQKVLQQAHGQIQKPQHQPHPSQQQLQPQSQKQQQQQQQQQQNIIEDSLSLGHFFKSKKPSATSTVQAINSQIFPTSAPSNSFQYNAIPTSAPSGPSAPSSLRPLAIQQQRDHPQSQQHPQHHPQQHQQHHQQQQQQQNTQPEIQVLYVPFESLYGNQQQQGQHQGIGFGQHLNPYDDIPSHAPFPTINPFHVNQFYTPEPLISSVSYRPSPPPPPPSPPPRSPSRPSTTPSTTTTTSTTTTSTTTTSTLKPKTATTITARRPTNIYENYLSALITTPKPKPKAHQPALAMFMMNSSLRPTQADVVDRLRNDRTIAVVDSPNQAIPDIFVGPAGMPTPSGYSKFELPYLSQLQGIYNLRDMAFYVAPMSYRTPAGFSKIYLPEPHVGSIVINLSKGNPFVPIPTQEIFHGIPKLPSNPYYNLQLQSDTSEKPSSTSTSTSSSTTTTTTTATIRPNLIKTSPNIITPTSFVEPSSYYQTFEHTTTRPRTTATTQRPKMNQRGNKYSYYSDQDSIFEIASTKATVKDRPKKKRPQNNNQEQIDYSNEQLLQIQNPYAQFNPIPNQIRDMDYFKLSINRPSSSSSSTSTTTTTTPSPPPPTTTTVQPQTYFAYNTSPDIDYHSSRGHLNPQSNQIPQGDYHATINTPSQSSQSSQSSQFYGNPELLNHNQFIQRGYQPNPSTPSPISSITADEEYQMKQYYRQQDAFRNRPKFIYQTTPDYEQEHYTPIDFDFAIAKNKMKDPKTTTTTTPSPPPMTTPPPPTTTTTTTTIKPRITFYSPSPAPQINEHLITITHNQNEENHNKNLPINHRATYDQNELTEGPIEYEPNPYELPSELPPLTPNLPGLVNDLLEKNKQNNTDQIVAIPASIQKEEEQTIRPTRRPINRLRKPTSTKISSSVSYSESESTSRRPSTRVRRPFGVKASMYINSNGNGNGNGNDGDNDYNLSNIMTTTSTKRPSFSRKPLIRNPNRIRYQPTPEERETLRIKAKRKYKGSSKKSETEDLDYQRDVLNQNYPVLKPTVTTKPKISTELPSMVRTTTEVPISESQQVFTVTPQNHPIDSDEQNYANGLLEPMQIAQQYSHYTDNYGPGYFPNQEDFNPTEPAIKNEIHSIYTTNKPEDQEVHYTASTTPRMTTTTESIMPEMMTRRAPFLRRNTYNRLRTTTTTEIPTTEQPVTEEKPLISFHIKNRPAQRKPLRLRPRNKRPLYTTTTSVPVAVENEFEEIEETQKAYERVNRYNDESSTSASTSSSFSSSFSTSEDDKRRHKTTRFQLDTEESQWSPSSKLGSTNHFKPINPKRYPLKRLNKYENEPDIITAEPKTENDNYEIEVTANYDGNKRIRMKQPNLRPEKTFAELLEEVMGKPNVEEQQEANNKGTISTESVEFESQKTNTDHRPNRRGKWKKVRVSPVAQMPKEHLETAESQNWNSVTYNVINATDGESNDVMTTSEVPHLYSVTTHSTIPGTMRTINFDNDLSTIKSDISTTTAATLSDSSIKENESATRRMDTFPFNDDTDTQSTLFSEVRKQLSNLFSIEDTDDAAVTAALAAGNKRRQQYIQIKRTRPETTTTMAATIRETLDDTIELSETTDATILDNNENKEQDRKFHKSLMEHVVYATSQTMIEQTSEAEICYRGRCIKSDELPPNHKLN